MVDWMRARRGDAQPILAGEPDELGPQPRHLAPGVIDVAADWRADFDHGIVHLPLDLILEAFLALGEHLLDVRLQLASLGIDDLKFLLDSERERRAWGRHGVILS